MSDKKSDQDRRESGKSRDSKNSGESGERRRSSSKLRGRIGSFWSSKRSEQGLTTEERVAKNKAVNAVQVKKDAAAKKFLIEALVYAIFLTLYCVIVTNLRNTWHWHTSEVVRVVLAEDGDWLDDSFDTITSVSQFWKWAEEVMSGSLWPTDLAGHDLTEQQRRFLVRSNYRLGAVRWRQLRVSRNQGCDVQSTWSPYIDHCYGDYSQSFEDTAPFGPNNTFTYYTGEQLCEMSVSTGTYCSAFTSGIRGHSYSSNGYIWDFKSNDHDQIVEEITFLKENEWIQPQTRAITVEFNLYNPNVGLVIACNFLVEIFPTGLGHTSYSIKAIPVLTLESSSQIGEFIGEIILMLFVVYFLYMEANEFYQSYKKEKEKCAQCMLKETQKSGEVQRFQCYICDRHVNPLSHITCPRCQREIEKLHICWIGYFQNGWNAIELCIAGLMMTICILRFEARGILYNFDYSAIGDDFFVLYPIAWRYAMSGWLNAFTSLLLFLKTFKFLGKFKQLGVVVNTITLALGEIAYFMVVFTVVFIGFAMSFHMAFGSDIAVFSSALVSSMELFATTLGEFQYTELEESNRALAPIFFFSYIILVFFVLANMFIAIIIGAYEQVLDESSKNTHTFLSSSLKLFGREIKRNVKEKIFGAETKWRQVQQLLHAMEELPELEEESKDQIRALRSEINHDTNPAGLLARLCHVFQNKPNKVPVKPEDFDTLLLSVLDYKNMIALGEKKTFELSDETANFMARSSNQSIEAIMDEITRRGIRLNKQLNRTMRGFKQAFGEKSSPVYQSSAAYQKA